MEPRSETYYIARWILPANIDKDTRLYVVIDPDNTIEEIHENNNKGYVKLNTNGSTGIEEKMTDTLPTEYRLLQNHPNPFNPATNISYSIPESGLVELKVYNILGQEVATLVNEFKKSGHYNVKFNPPDLSSGVYFYSLISGSYSVTKKMLIIK
ncbi:T9SS type A sorting domain-containing protein [candidate division KSB1 bacterium]|nr:T9SS type A sorting domain-containing protein [candidate division KSB1 bacterium]